MDLRTANVTRYILPLREGGSLPALAEADDEFKYVVKFRGAGHGTKALIAELIGGEIARTLGFRVPEIIFLNLDEAFGRTEADEEIQDLLQWSRGLNMGLHFLSGSLTFDPVVHKVDGKTASQIVWLDALLTNVDRTIKNTNMLMWHKELWLIDHGASLYFHHSWTNWQKHALSPFVQIKDHVLLPFADQLEEVDATFKQLLTDDKIREIVNAVPDDWLNWTEGQKTPQDLRDVSGQTAVIVTLPNTPFWLNVTTPLATVAIVSSLEVHSISDFVQSSGTVVYPRFNTFSPIAHIYPLSKE